MKKNFSSAYQVLFLSVAVLFLSIRPLTAQSATDASDLDVQTISMAPLHSENSCKAAFHRGQPVRIIATIRNSGDVAATAWSYEWLIDGKKVGAGRVYDPLPTGRSISIRMDWRWLPGRRYVQFIANPSHSEPEISYENNSLQIATDAWSMLWIISKQTYDAFNVQSNFPGAQSFADWAQWHVRRINRLMLTSPKPRIFMRSPAPAIRCEKILVCANPQKTYRELSRDSHGAPLHDFDAIWVLDDSKTKIVNASSHDLNIFRQWASALGAIPDSAFYRNSFDNFATGSTNIPLLISHRERMAGSQTLNSDTIPFNQEEIGALFTLYAKNTHSPEAYLYCIPRICRIRVLDAQGKPVKGAHLTFRLDRDGAYSPSPSFYGTTNGSGEFTLPNRPVPTAIRRQFHVGKWNPFGAISPRTNSVMLITISARRQTEYHWLDVPKLNRAYWNGRGNSTTISFHTRIPPIHALRAPMALVGSNERNRIYLHWKPVRNAIAYHLYRATTSECRYQSCAVIQGYTSWQGVFGNEPMDRFVVTSIDSHGNESAYSNTLRMVQMKNPWGIAIGENGWRYIKDAGWGRILVQNPNGAWIGMMGSNVGILKRSYGIAPYSNGELLVALCGNGSDPRPGFAILSSTCRILFIHREPLGNSPGACNSPMGIAANSKGNIFVADTNNGRVQEFTPKGKLIRIIGAKELHYPMNVAFDANGRLYVVDFYTNKIDIYTPQPKGGYRLTDKLDGVDEPVYATVDKYGRVFAASHRYAAIHMFDKKRVDVWVWYGTTSDHLSGPRGIAFTNNGYALVVDNALQKVLKVKIPPLGAKLKPVEEIEKDDDD